MQTAAQQNTALVRFVSAGVIGGAAGGVVFGIMMAAMGMMPMIAGLIGSSSDVVGFIVHMAISIFIGATFGLAFGPRSTKYVQGLAFGVVWGALWWVLGPLLIMPAMMGMPLFVFNQMTLTSLVGHLIYGGIAGLAFAWFINR
jgi:hypothetical protein